jgi:Protein of unknown function (DUF1153)
MAPKPVTILRFPVGAARSPRSTLSDPSEIDLPAANTKRWVIRRKAAVVNAVNAGILTLDDACQRYKLSIEEFHAWRSLVERHGPSGLRVTRLQDHRLVERR